jgi:hypothetical protein
MISNGQRLVAFHFSRTVLKHVHAHRGLMIDVCSPIINRPRAMYTRFKNYRNSKICLGLIENYNDHLLVSGETMIILASGYNFFGGSIILVIQLSKH